MPTRKILLNARFLSLVLVMGVSLTRSDALGINLEGVDSSTSAAAAVEQADVTPRSGEPIEGTESTGPSIVLGSSAIGTGIEPPNGASGDGGTGVRVLDEVVSDNSYNVYLFSGETFVEQEDLRIPGRGFDFVWKRKYRSREGQNSSQGVNWDFSYNIRVEAEGADLRLYDGNSRNDLYVWNATAGQWESDGTESLSPSGG